MKKMLLVVALVAIILLLIFVFRDVKLSPRNVNNKEKVVNFVYPGVSNDYSTAQEFLNKVNEEFNRGK